MAAEVVGGAFLTASLEVLSARIPSITGFVRRSKLDTGLFNELEIMLLSVERVLNDAEKKQFTKPKVRQWLQKLNDAIHDAEDLVDEINTEALRCQIEGDQSQSSRTFGAFSFDQVSNFFSSRFTVKGAEQRIQNILNTLIYIVEKKKHLGLREGVKPISSFRRSCATALVKQSDIYGRDAEKQTIRDFLLSDAGDKISVLPIVGMGGIGKTTLAQLVYNEIIEDKVMEKPFQIKAWITVSEESDVFRLTQAIYKAFVPDSSSSTIKETLQLQLKLKEFLEGKKFLLVLDDVWNLDDKRWYDLRSSFESSAQGSKIIVTTRSTKIASDLGTVSKLDLQIISEEDCWQLFKKHAFHNVEPSVYPDLEVIGSQIVRKCKGLPLAVKSLASLLRSVQDPKDWKNVLKNDIWNLSEYNILPALWLSYYYMPPHLKRCFAYCSIFPKNYEIQKEKLILLWMAQDLLQPHKTKKPEEVGEEYFKELVSRSFFQYYRGGDENYITMHDLVNDLAMFVSGEYCLRFEDNNSDELIKKTRHFSYLRRKTNDEKKIKGLYENKVLRTLLEVDIHTSEQLQSMQFLRVLSLHGRLRIEAPWTTKKLKLVNSFLPKKKLNSIGNLKLLRYLDLSGSVLEEIPDTIGTLYNLQTLLLTNCFGLTSLPDSIGNLKHLRYLDLGGTSIEKLPDTICQLHELHTLILNRCWKLTHLPANIATLINLRNLDISGTQFTEMPPQMSNLKNLQTSTYFAVGKDSGSNIKELGKLKDLHGCLRIEGLENIVNVEDVYSEANLMDKKRITELELKWIGDIDDLVKTQKVLDRLRPHTDLEVLRIENYGGTRFLHWFGHPSFSCLTSVRLVDCKNCYMLPPLGQLPCLEDLQIKGFDKVGRIGDEFYNDGSSHSVLTKPFGSLKKIFFEGMAEWEEWASVDVDGGVFTNLKVLELLDCPKLKGACLPDYLPSLEILRIFENDNLVASLSRCRYPSLRSLIIENCLGIKSFSGPILPSNIQRIDIKGCPEIIDMHMELKSFPNWGGYDSFSCLIKVDLVCCKSCYCLPPLGELPSLKKLHIQGFDRVERIGDEFYSTDILSLSKPFKSLESLTFSHMLWWKEWSFMKSGVFSDLKELTLDNCRKLKGMCFPNYLPSLKSLLISGCKQEVVASLSTDGLPLLSFLKISHCKELESFPIRTLPANVDTVKIMGCKELVSLSEDGWPSKLKSLEISYCGKLFGNTMRWSLQTLTSLTSLQIIKIDEVVDSFPKEWQLPSSLKSLTLRHFRNLKSLNGKALQHHTSLKELKIEFCHHLQYLPEERLPGSLSLLQISGCVFLNRRCQKKRGEDWPKIAHIPHIQIDFKDI